MNSKSNKISYLYGFIIVVAFLSYLMTVYQKNKPLSLEARTEQRALLIGTRLIESHLEQKLFLPDEGKQERGLASTEDKLIVKKSLSGETGRDTWGQPFLYHVKGDGIKNSVLYMWSLGPNGVADYKDIKDLIAQGPKNDDILVTIPF